MEDSQDSSPDAAPPEGRPHDASHPQVSHEHPPGTASFLPDAWWGLSLLRRREVAAGLALLVVVVIGVSLFLVLSGGGDSSDSPDSSDDAAGAGAATTTTTVDAAAYVAALPPERVDTWNSIAQCESSGNWDDDTGNGFYGGLQFTQESWETVGGTGNPADASQDEQIMRAQMLEDIQGWEAWPECAAQLGLT